MHQPSPIFSGGPELSETRTPKEGPIPQDAVTLQCAAAGGRPSLLCFLCYILCLCCRYVCMYSILCVCVYYIYIHIFIFTFIFTRIRVNIHVCLLFPFQGACVCVFVSILVVVCRFNFL